MNSFFPLFSKNVRSIDFIDRILSPNVINSDQELEKLLIEGVDSLERGEGIVTTDDWWEQEREHLISNSLNLLAK